MGLTSRSNFPVRVMRPGLGAASAAGKGTYGPGAVLAPALGTRWKKASKAGLSRWRLTQ